MKKLKLFFTLLLFMAGVTLALSLIMPVKQRVEKSVTIYAPAHVVYQELSLLKNFPQWAAWSRFDSTVQYTISGTDGSTGAVTRWTGDSALSGKGRVEITGLDPDKKIEQHIEFISPQKGKAVSVFNIQDNGRSVTVTWIFEKSTPRPSNIFNLFYSMEKQMGRDFEDGLAALKTVAEKKSGNAADTRYTVEPMNFPGAVFACIRQPVQGQDMEDFIRVHTPMIREALLKAGATPGSPAGLIYSPEDKNGITDLAAALPVQGDFKPEGPLVRLENIPASKAVFINYYGSRNQITDAYRQAEAYLKENKLSLKYPVIEQYLTGPGHEKDTSRRLTKIVFCVE